MKVLVFGKSGQVASALQRVSSQADQITFLDRRQADFGSPESIGEHVMACDADAIINAVAYTAVDAAETEEATALRVNAESPAAIAVAAARRGLPFLHISSDYVFDGRGDAPFRPDAKPNPLGTYGRTKFAGEELVRAAGGAHVILRTSWVFSQFGQNFVKTMLRLCAERNQISVVADQFGGPTPASAVAEALMVIARAMIAGHAGGTYHLSGAPDTNWADFARAIVAQGGLACEVRNIASADYPTPAHRPRNSRLDCATLRADFGIERPDWRRDLSSIVEEIQT